MTHAQHSREAALYRRESRRGHRDMPRRTFDPATDDLILAWPHKTYRITKEGLIR